MTNYAVSEVTGHEILHSVDSILIPVHFQYHLVRVTDH
jgi:hypothetical protein